MTPSTPDVATLEIQARAMRAAYLRDAVARLFRRLTPGHGAGVRTT